MRNNNNTLAKFSNDLADAVENAAPAVVLVDGRRRFPASGILVAEDLVLTADHVLEKDKDIRIVLEDGQELTAAVAGRDPSSDLAVLKLSESVSGSATPFTGEVRVGEIALALGRHSTKGIEASFGVISHVNGPVRTHRGGVIGKFIRTDAIPLPGFSGGALVNARGQIVGINTSGLSHGTLLTIPAAVAWNTAQTLAEHGGIKRGYLGVRSQTVEIPEAAFTAIGREQKSGLLVTHVEADSPAAGSDLRAGDIIVGVSGEPVSDHDELAGKLVGEIVGQAAAVDVLRVGQLLTLDVTIGERRQRRHKRPRRRPRDRRKNPRTQHTADHDCADHHHHNEHPHPKRHHHPRKRHS